MNTYTFDIYARQIGAIGINSHFTVSVQAETYEQAELKLYDTHENIHGKKLISTVPVSN